MHTSNRARIALAMLGLVLASCQQQQAPSGPSVSEGAAGDSGEVGVSSSALITGSATLTPSADTVLRLAIPFGNDGTGQRTGVTAASVADVERSIIRFNTNSIRGAIPAGRVLQSARLDVKVTNISAGWLGGAIDIHAMNREWVEGTGLAGNGASWACANDTNTTWIGLPFNDCTAANNWSMVPGGPFPRPFDSAATDRVPVFTGGLTTISFDVTADVQKVIQGGNHFGWMLAGAPNLAGGLWAHFGSREAPAANRPQLVISYGTDDCPNDPNKGLVGACGCGKPELDANLDNVPDCFEASVIATGDTALRVALPFMNDGTGLLLPTTAVSVVDIERSLIKVGNNAIAAATRGAPIQKAYLELTVAGIAFGWAGGQIAIHRMNAAPQWVEGTGLAGYGASWTCANDVNTTFSGPGNDCNIWDDWFMSPFQWTIFPKPYLDPATATAGVTWPGMTSVRFDVTADVHAFLANPSSNNGWIIQGHASNFASGNWVNFGSRESGAPPRLLLELPDACPSTGKTSPGACGCAIPETDRDTDGTPDCVDECPDDNPQIVKGTCGCGPEVDSDTDGLENCIDPCPYDADVTLGGGCGCPSDIPAPSGTECTGLCVTPNDPSGTAVCDGAGHCGDPSSCIKPDPTCSSCTPYVVRGLSQSSLYSVYWNCPCPRTGDIAQSRCDAMPGFHLVKIDSPEKNAFVRGLIDSDTWIGANDRGAEGAWRWAWTEGPGGDPFWNGGSSGSPAGAAYANWQSSEPGGGTGENCGVMSFASVVGDWQDRSCGQSLDFICERALDTASDTIGTGGSGGGTIPTDKTCVFNGTPCLPFPVACTPDPQATEEELEAQKLALETCEACTLDASKCAQVDNPTQAQLDQCAANCASSCVGAAEPPQPGDVPCTDMRDYDLESAIFVDPPPQKHCPIDVPSTFSGLVACDNHEQCRNQPDGKTHCGEVFHCRDCDPTSTQASCFECAGELDPGQDPPGPNAQCSPVLGGCIAEKYCGVPEPECFLVDNDYDVECVETNICPNPEDVHTSLGPTNATALETPAVFTAQFNVPPVPAPDPFFPEDPPCTGNGCVPPNDASHPWCHYDVTEGLAPQMPPSASKQVETGNSSSLTFTVDPHLHLRYQTDLGPLGMPLPLLAAEGRLESGAFISIFKLDRYFPLIDIAAGARGGIHRDSVDENNEVCGFKAYAKAEIFGIDILPERVNFRRPNRTADGDDAQAECFEAVEDFQKVVDSAHKAFADARELVRQYQALKAQSRYFSDGTNGALSLCQQIAASPPRGFPVWFPCNLERPVDTINRFIEFYNKTVIDNVRTAAFELGTKLDALVEAQGVNGRYSILQPVREDEQITLFNTTFPIGPVPANLEVLLTAQYGFGAQILAELRIGQLMGNLVAAGPLDGHPVFKVGLEGGPSAGLGLSLFAGVGFDIGFAAAKLGIEGAVDVGHVELPVNAWTGIGVSTKPDLREPPMSWASFVDAEAGHLIPTQRLAFDLMYGYGAKLRLNHVLSGSLGLALKIKFFFFSKTWRKSLVTFSGLCPKDGAREAWCDLELFSAGGRSRLPWGEIQLPMPFYAIKSLPQWPIDPVGTETFDTTQVGELFYDSLCQCIPHWDDANPPEDDCFRNEDCCGHESDPNLVCYENPEPVDGVLRSQCTGCRSMGQNCREDSDCCNAGFLSSCFKDDPDDPNAIGVCRILQVECGDCRRDQDCFWSDPPFICSGGNHCVYNSDRCGIIR